MDQQTNQLIDDSILSKFDEYIIIKIFNKCLLNNNLDAVKLFISSKKLFNCYTNNKEFLEFNIRYEMFEKYISISDDDSEYELISNSNINSNNDSDYNDDKLYHELKVNSNNSDNLTKKPKIKLSYDQYSEIKLDAISKYKNCKIHLIIEERFFMEKYIKFIELYAKNITKLTIREDTYKEYHSKFSIENLPNLETFEVSTEYLNIKLSNNNVKTVNLENLNFNLMENENSDDNNSDDNNLDDNNLDDESNDDNNSNDNNSDDNNSNDNNSNDNNSDDESNDDNLDYNNRRYVDIIEQIGMNNVENLTINDCHLKTVKSINKLTKLKSVCIYKSDIKDLDTIFELKNLSKLHLSDVKIKLDKLDSNKLNNLKSVIDLNLSELIINDYGFIKKYCLELKKLTLRLNGFKKLSPLQDLTELTYLDLYSNDIKDISKLSKLTKLEYINLGQNKIKDIKVFSNFKKLREIRLDENKISNIKPISECVELDCLCLYKNEISDISPLRKLQNLKKIYLSDNKITNIDILQHMPNLNYISINDNQINNFDILYKLTNLYFIDISGNIDIKNIDPTKFKIYDESMKTSEYYPEIMIKKIKRINKTVDYNIFLSYEKYSVNYYRHQCYAYYLPYRYEDNDTDDV
jgi:hypothetical protein